MAELVLYGSPASLAMSLQVDNGFSVLGIGPQDKNGRGDAYCFDLPFVNGGIGARLRVTCEGYTTIEQRGVLSVSEDSASYTADDFIMQLAPTTPVPEPPPVDPTYPKDPEGIINYVYAIGNYDLSTKEGCGIFTEDCCTALHVNHRKEWGHIRKNPGQNQYNGHAVDAVMLAAGEGCGIYDIIHDSESSSATPAYNYKGEPDLSLWYYPAAVRSKK